MDENIKEPEKRLEKVDNKKETSDSEGTSNIIPDDLLEAIPIEDRGRFKNVITKMMFSGVMKRGNPISEKITSEHISRLIENSNIQDERDRKERKSDKNYKIIFLLIGLFFLAFLIFFLKDDKELLYKIIIAVFSFIGGFGLGKQQ